MTSLYARRIAQLSARIFGEILIDKNTPNGRIITRLAQKPIHKMDEYSMSYYPRHQEIDQLFKVLRYHGLYRYDTRIEDFITIL
jgi:small subunit ribosomal protein S33